MKVAATDHVFRFTGPIHLDVRSRPRCDPLDHRAERKTVKIGRFDVLVTLCTKCGESKHEATEKRPLRRKPKGAA